MQDAENFALSQPGKPPNQFGGCLYGPLVIAYLFLGGAAAGGMFVMSAWSLASARSSGIACASLRHAQAFNDLRSRVYPLCFLLLVFAIVMLFWDLEHPDRVLLVFLRPHPTPITFGAWSLSIEAVLAALLIVSASGKYLTRGSSRRIIEVLCCVCSLAVMAYTGTFLASTKAVAFWDTWLLMPLFVCSSLSSGLSIMLLVDYLIPDQSLLLRGAKPLQLFHLAVLAAELVFLALFIHAAFVNPAAAASCKTLLSADVFPLACIGVLGFGVFIPAALETYSLLFRSSRTIPVSDALCLCGSLLLRYCIVICAA